MFDIQVHQNFGKTIHVINFFPPSQPSVQRNFHEGSSPDLATPDEALHKGDNNLTLGEGERGGRPRAVGARVQVRVQVRFSRTLASSSARSILPSNTVRQLLPSTNIPLSSSPRWGPASGGEARGGKWKMC